MPLGSVNVLMEETSNVQETYQESYQVCESLQSGTQNENQDCENQTERENEQSTSTNVNSNIQEPSQSMNSTDKILPAEVLQVKDKPPSIPADDKLNSIYHIKWISMNNHKTPIVTQNENGPCPLLAIINVLLLRGRVHLPDLVNIVTSNKLIEHIAGCMLDSIPKNISEDTQLNYEQNISDAISILPKLQTGLDVNVKFTGVGDFEYTPECIIFDLLRIPLYHGWIIDPQMTDVLNSIGTCSYNQLVEKIINFKLSPDPDKVTEALVAESFLEKTASQLTYFGLWKLNASLHEDELCVLFRNNHFISLIKRNNILYQLVTDQGFLNENVAWETLDNIDGDHQFVDSDFIPVPPKSSPGVVLPSDVPMNQQIDQDYLVALSLQEEQKKQQKSELEWEEYKKLNLGANSDLPDEELARRLQEEENKENQRSESQSPHQSPPSSSGSNSGRNRKSDCVIL